MIPSRKAVLPSGKTPWRAASASRAIALRRRGFIKRPPRPASLQRLFALSPTGMLVACTHGRGAYTIALPLGPDVFKDGFEN